MKLHWLGRQNYLYLVCFRLIIGFKINFKQDEVLTGVEMRKKQFGRYAYVLGKTHSLDILELIQSMGWSKASDIAKELDLHVATASKYLAELEEIKVLEVRRVKGKTRMVLEYRLKDPKINLNLDLSATDVNPDIKDEVTDFYRDIYKSLLNLTESIYGIIPTNLDENTTKKESITESLRRLLEYNEERMGLVPTQRLVCRACEPVVVNHNKLVEEQDPFKDLPSRYFEILKEDV